MVANLKIDEYGRSILTDSELCNLLYFNPSLQIDNVNLTNPQKYNSAIQKLFLDWKPLEKLEELSISKEQYHKQNQQVWFMPQEYINMDIAKWILEQCQNQNELQRAGQELMEYAERDLLPLLTYLKYLVDIMKINKVVWGVGRGSSVASFVLYLIGVHRIHSLRHNLDFNEFMR